MFESPDGKNLTAQELQQGLINFREMEYDMFFGKIETSPSFMSKIYVKLCIFLKITKPVLAESLELSIKSEMHQ